MARGYQIKRSDGKLYASPAFTPHILYSIEDIGITTSSTRVNYKTSVDYSDSALVFFYSLSGKGVHFFTTNVDGKLTLSALSENNHTIRVYIFDNKVRFLPSRGIFIYDSGRVVYAGNCLPLVIKSVKTSGLVSDAYPKGNLAAKPGFGSLVANGIGSNEWIWVSTAWGADQSGGVINAPIASGTSQAISFDSDPELLYIDRTIYDKYRQTGIGY